MCRSIHRLRQGDHIAGEQEIRDAARQFVRKISGFHHPSRRHEVAFERAVDEVTAAAAALLDAVAAELKATG